MNIKKLRELCLGLPGATEDIKWGADLCFCVGKKMFCVTGLESAVFMVSLKVLDEEFDEMCSRPGIRPADYVARYKWITIENAASLSAKEWDHYVRQSYALVRAKLPKKIRDSIG